MDETMALGRLNRVNGRDIGCRKNARPSTPMPGRDGKRHDFQWLTRWFVFSTAKQFQGSAARPLADFDRGDTPETFFGP
jgi:hypothetical protein